MNGLAIKKAGMSISKESELIGMQQASEAVSFTLRKMREYARVGMCTSELDAYGGQILKEFGASSAPFKTYGFPGYTCISINNEIAHGIPKVGKKLKEGDLINIDVSAELKGFWSDNGGSFVLGNDINNFQPLVNASKEILRIAISGIRDGVKIADTGSVIEEEAKIRGYRVIRNLAGHGIGLKLHEAPHEILNYGDPKNNQRFKENSVVAIETFISTVSNLAIELKDGWTLVGNKGGYVTQHEHTILITKDVPVILTKSNGIWDE